MRSRTASDRDRSAQQAAPRRDAAHDSMRRSAASLREPIHISRSKPAGGS